MPDQSPSPRIVGRAAFEAEIESLRTREKAHTREGDAIAAARRRLPMTEVDGGLELLGPDGPTTLLAAFEDRRLLIAYYFMWNPAAPAAEQREGCTFYTGQVRELSALHSRGVTFAVFSQGRNVSTDFGDAQTSYREALRYRVHGLDDAVVFGAALARCAARQPRARPVPHHLLPARG